MKRFVFKSQKLNEISRYKNLLNLIFLLDSIKNDFCMIESSVQNANSTILFLNLTTLFKKVSHMA